jgi:2-oxoisovalerate dehydrogenase E1 component
MKASVNIPLQDEGEVLNVTDLDVETQAVHIEEDARQSACMACSAEPMDNRSLLSVADLINMYRVMYLSRRTDDREIVLKKQQKTFFQISSAGHEALSVAAGFILKAGHDWFYPYYRDRALCLALGSSVEDQLLQSVGAGSDPASGGRMMPSHWSNRKLNIVSQSSPTGTQCLQAVGCAEAGRYFALHADAAESTTGDYRQYAHVKFQSDEVVYVSLGEGATSQGEFWEALNVASNLRLPVVFVVQDNGFAISVPVEVSTAGGNISRLVEGFPNLRVLEVDGTDLIESHSALKAGVAYCRSGAGPSFVHGHVIRPYSHSSSDDERWYKLQCERRAEGLRDPIPKTRRLILERRLLTEEALCEMEASVEVEIERATTRAVEALPAEASTVKRHVYSELISPMSSQFCSVGMGSDSEETLTMAEGITACFREEMRRDKRIVVFGEDVADSSRPADLDSEPLKGKGGVFGVTAGLQREFGPDRVFNTPLAEAGVVGRAIGYATRGMKPVIEIQFMDFIWPAMQQIKNELAVMRWRSNGEYAAPVVMRVAFGGYLAGGGVYHSQTSESTFTHIAGLRVVCPSNARDAHGLLRTAIRCDDPVLFLEHKRLYRNPSARVKLPPSGFTVPFGKASIVLSGQDLTIVTFGALVSKALEAAALAKRDLGLSVEVIDLRSLNPYDWDTIAQSVKKTSRVIVGHEDCLSWGYGAEIAARISDELFYDLDTPVKRVGARDTCVAYQPALEEAILPQVSDFMTEIRTILAS